MAVPLNMMFPPLPPETMAMYMQIMASKGAMVHPHSVQRLDMRTPITLTNTRPRKRSNRTSQPFIRNSRPLDGLSGNIFMASAKKTSDAPITQIHSSTQLLEDFCCKFDSLSTDLEPQSSTCIPLFGGTILPIAGELPSPIPSSSSADCEDLPQWERPLDLPSGLLCYALRLQSYIDMYIVSSSEAPSRSLLLEKGSEVSPDNFAPRTMKSSSLPAFMTFSVPQPIVHARPSRSSEIRITSMMASIRSRMIERSQMSQLVETVSFDKETGGGGATSPNGNETENFKREVQEIEDLMSSIPQEYRTFLIAQHEFLIAKSISQEHNLELNTNHSLSMTKIGDATHLAVQDLQSRLCRLLNFPTSLMQGPFMSPYPLPLEPHADICVRELSREEPQPAKPFVDQFADAPEGVLWGCSFLKEMTSAPPFENLSDPCGVAMLKQSYSHTATATQAIQPHIVRSFLSETPIETVSKSVSVEFALHDRPDQTIIHTQPKSHSNLRAPLFPPVEILCAPAANRDAEDFSLSVIQQHPETIDPVLNIFLDNRKVMNGCENIQHFFVCGDTNDALDVSFSSHSQNNSGSRASDEMAETGDTIEPATGVDGYLISTHITRHDLLFKGALANTNACKAFADATTTIPIRPYKVPRAGPLTFLPPSSRMSADTPGVNQDVYVETICKAISELTDQGRLGLLGTGAALGFDRRVLRHFGSCTNGLENELLADLGETACVLDVDRGRRANRRRRGTTNASANSSSGKVNGGSLLPTTISSAQDQDTEKGISEKVTIAQVIGEENAFKYMRFIEHVSYLSRFYSNPNSCLLPDTVLSSRLPPVRRQSTWMETCRDALLATFTQEGGYHTQNPHCDAFKMTRRGIVVLPLTCLPFFSSLPLQDSSSSLNNSQNQSLPNSLLRTFQLTPPPAFPSPPHERSSTFSLLTREGPLVPSRAIQILSTIHLLMPHIFPSRLLLPPPANVSLPPSLDPLSVWHAPHLIALGRILSAESSPPRLKSEILTRPPARPLPPQHSFSFLPPDPQTTSASTFPSMTAAKRPLSSRVHQFADVSSVSLAVPPTELEPQPPRTEPSLAIGRVRKSVSTAPQRRSNSHAGDAASASSKAPSDHLSVANRLINPSDMASSLTTNAFDTTSATSLNPPFQFAGTPNRRPAPAPLPPFLSPPSKRLQQAPNAAANSMTAANRFSLCPTTPGPPTPFNNTANSQSMYNNSVSPFSPSIFHQQQPYDPCQSNDMVSLTSPYGSQDDVHQLNQLASISTPTNQRSRSTDHLEEAMNIKFRNSSSSNMLSASLLLAEAAASSILSSPLHTSSINNIKQNNIIIVSSQEEDSTSNQNRDGNGDVLTPPRCPSIPPRSHLLHAFPLFSSANSSANNMHDPVSPSNGKLLPNLSQLLAPSPLKNIPESTPPRISSTACTHFAVVSPPRFSSSANPTSHSSSIPKVEDSLLSFTPSRFDLPSPSLRMMSFDRFGATPPKSFPPLLEGANSASTLLSFLRSPPRENHSISTMSNALDDGWPTETDYMRPTQGTKTSNQTSNNNNTK